MHLEVYSYTVQENYREHSLSGEKSMHIQKALQQVLEQTGDSRLVNADIKYSRFFSFPHLLGHAGFTIINTTTLPSIPADIFTAPTCNFIPYKENKAHVYHTDLLFWRNDKAMFRPTLEVCEKNVVPS